MSILSSSPLPISPASLLGTLLQLLRSFNFYPTEEELKKAIAEVDADGSGEVEFPEFVELINRLDRGTTHTEEQIIAVGSTRC